MSSTEVPFRRLGPYVLLQLSGAGGMGRVDVALSIKRGGFTKVCVLKRILPDLRTPEQEARFRREATIALRLSHGAIAQTLDVVEVEGELCLLQEFVHGTTLAHLENRAGSAGEPIPVELAAHVGAEVARALAYAHSFDGGGIFNRDVTPDNVMVSFAGEAKLVDFGIARAPADQPLTEVGFVVGRPLYTAPEVLAGESPSPRSDIYSLGVLLWQVLARRPFEGPGQTSIEPPSKSNAAVPAGLDALVMRALSRRPEQRFASAQELQGALAGFVPSVPPADQVLAAFLARHFNVDRERKELAQDIERARRTAESDVDRPVQHDVSLDAAGPPAKSAARRAAVALAAICLVAGGGGGWLGARRGDARQVREPIAILPPVPPTAPSPQPQALPSRSSPSAPVAAAAVEQAVRSRRPKNTGGADLARNGAALLRDANRSFASGDLAQAMELARQAVREGAAGGGHLVMGKIFYAKNQLAAAEAEFQKAHGAAPDDPETGRYLELVRADLGKEPR